MNKISAPKQKIGLQRKIATMVCFSMFVAMIVLLGLVYLSGSGILRASAGKQMLQVADLLNSEVSQQVTGEVEDIETYAARPLWIQFVEKANPKYEKMTEPQILGYFAEMDKKWIAADATEPFVKDYTDNVIGNSMKAILDIRKNVAEIFVTDRMGGLIAASGKTTDFYQADEEWWQKAFNNGKGDLYISNIELDKSSATWSISMAAPMKNSEGAVVGICKQSISAYRLFQVLENLHIGNTGHATLIDSNSNIIFHTGIVPMTKKFYALNKLQPWRSKNTGVIALPLSEIHNYRLLAAFAAVESPYLLKYGIRWVIVISQNINESLETIILFMRYLLIIAGILIIIMLPIGFLVAGRLMKPIKKLSIAAEHISKGELDYAINIHTGDELEQFANDFRTMILSIKNDRQKLLEAKKELQKFSENLEKKVEERTTDLKNTQEATLNILEDLTDSKAELEGYSNDLEKALKMKSDFTSTVSHELRTPLAAIKESIAIVLDETAGALGDKQKEFLNISKRNVDRLTRLINDLLDFQKMESGRQTFNFEENDINGVIKDAVKDMAPLAANKDLTFSLGLAGRIPKTRFDKDKIVQVLINLIGNAIKYTDAGSVTVSTSNTADSIVVSVKDTGIGIKKEDLHKLFEQFSQIESISDRRVGGTGLGLAISKKIVDAHSGKIWVDSAPGKGSTFSFSLPIKTGNRE